MSRYGSLLWCAGILKQTNKKNLKQKTPLFPLQRYMLKSQLFSDCWEKATHLIRNRISSRNFCWLGKLEFRTAYVSALWKVLSEATLFLIVLFWFYFCFWILVPNTTEPDYKSKDWVFLNYTYKRFEGLTQRGSIPSYMKARKLWNKTETHKRKKNNKPQVAASSHPLGISYQYIDSGAHQFHKEILQD